MGIKTDVIEVGSFKFSNIQSKERPLKARCCISQLGVVRNGTVCCIVRKKISRFFQKDKYDYYILSNNHVLADFNRNPIGTIFTQPNTNIPEDIVARLDTYVPIKIIREEEKPINYVDCAIAKLTNNSLISDMVLRFGKIKGVAKAELGMELKKYGFKSGISRGVVKSLDLITIMNTPDKKMSAKFKDQILVDMFNEAGDSGALILTLDNKLVGMGMSSGNEIGAFKYHSFVINDINLVLEYLKVELYISDISII